MSCENTNPCEQPCTDCSPSNPGYDNCGCINPTTWECISAPGVLSALNVTNDMTGKEVLQAINDVLSNLVTEEPIPGTDIFAKVSNTDTTASYLDSKFLGSTHITKAVINPGANEKLKFSLNLPSIISSNEGNILELGTDGKLRVIPSAVDPDVKVVGGSGVTVTGAGSLTDPFIVAINPSISVVRSCFDNVWRNINLVASGNANVVFVSGTPQYRYRFDGTIEFRGSITYTVSFGTYSSGNRKFTIPMGNIPVTCITALEQAGVVDMKSMNYIDTPQASADQITQQYGYIIRKNAQNLTLEFQSSFSTATTKTIVVNFEGCVSHPNI